MRYEVEKGGIVLATFTTADLLPGEDTGDMLECARVYNAVEHDGAAHIFECSDDGTRCYIGEPDEEGAEFRMEFPL